MKFTVETEINKPIDTVVKLFSNPDNQNKWMEGFQSSILQSGTERQPGAVSKIKFIIGKRKIDMIETILVNNLPEEFTCTYETKGVFNTVKNIFVISSIAKTKYISDQEFQFKGFIKIIAFLMPGAFKKQSKKYLTDFKRFAENS